MSAGADAGAGAGADATRWTVRAVLDAAAGVLEGRGVDEARLDATLLLAHALSVERLHLYMQMDRPLGEPERERYRGLIRERARRVPVAYLTGRQGFFALDLEVARGVLIPRPDTERLVEAAIERLASPDALVADLGTGSGAIAIAIARFADPPPQRIFAVDRSDAALAVARRNVEALGVADRVELLAGDLYGPLEERALAGRLDLIASNPPYVAERERAGLAPELQHEPAEALFAGEDGLAVIRRLVAGAARLLRPGGRLLVEIGHQQGAAVRALAEAAGLLEVEVLRDLDGRDRVLSARSSPGC